MIKFLLTPFLLISSTIIVYINPNYIPLFTLIYSIFIILGDLVLPRDYKIYDDKGDFIGTAIYDYKNKFIIREKTFKLRIL